MQSGEAGPFAQAIAGIDLALWDLARTTPQDVPLWRTAAAAPGDNDQGLRQRHQSDRFAAMAEAAMRARPPRIEAQDRLRAPPRDLANLAALRGLAGNGMLAADANQAWTVERARRAGARLAEYNPAWLEEPLRADRPWQEWQRLAQGGATAARRRREHRKRRRVRAGRWATMCCMSCSPTSRNGAASACCTGIATEIIKAGKIFCPHYLGGGIGLLASAHLLAGVGGDGLLEVDANDNPLRDRFCGRVADIRDGTITLGDEPGLGIEPDLAAIEQFRTM